jgi:ElaB/YqjD/DUF883 family membrane-anchored ribosome-binding protein
MRAPRFVLFSLMEAINDFLEEKGKLDQLEIAEDQLRQFSRNLDQCLQQNPWGAVLLSGVAGLCLGLLLTRSRRKPPVTKGFFNA